MKKIYLSGLLAVLFIISCLSKKETVMKDSHTKITIEKAQEEIPDDSTEYELLIMDPKFDSFLVTQPSKEFYSNDYYKLWNVQYVTEWNIRHANPLKYGDFFENHIDYNTNIDYGIDLNYKLYNYFLFIDKEYGIKLIHRAKP